MIGDDVLSRVVRIQEGVRLKTLPQGTVALSFPTGQAFELNHSGAAVLNAITSAITVATVIAIVADHYGIDTETATPHVLSFLDQCSQLDLVSISAAQPGV